MIIPVKEIFSSIKAAISAWGWVKQQLNNKAVHAIPRIERYINSQSLQGPVVTLFRLTNEVPDVIVEGALKLDDVVIKSADRKRTELTLNELHAVAIGWDGARDVRSIEAKTCDFAQLEALRDAAKEKKSSPPPVISANALIVSASKRKLILHRRSVNSATYGAKLHLLGGAFKPLQRIAPFEIPGDRNSLEFTMIREVFEEAGVIVRRNSEPICVSQEVNTGFVQYVFLGVAITETQYARLCNNREGEIEELSFDSLPQKLASAGDWVDSGRAQVLLWLALGAPGSGVFAKFAGMTPGALFDQVVGSS